MFRYWVCTTVIVEPELDSKKVIRRHELEGIRHWMQKKKKIPAK